MLREIPNARQHPDEPHRRWFHCAEQDLYVWEDGNGGITAFQLCYGKPASEHAIYWRADRGFAHLRVNDGESGWGNETPLLIADGVFAAEPTLQEFLDLAQELPPSIVDFVRKRLHAYTNIGLAP